jgi:hypothetical protein
MADGVEGTTEGLNPVGGGRWRGFRDGDRRAGVSQVQIAHPIRLVVILPLQAQARGFVPAFGVVGTGGAVHQNGTRHCGPHHRVSGQANRGRRPPGQHMMRRGQAQQSQRDRLAIAHQGGRGQTPVTPHAIAFPRGERIVALDQEVREGVRVPRDAWDAIGREQLDDFIAPLGPNHIQAVTQHPQARTRGVDPPGTGAHQPGHGVEQVALDGHPERGRLGVDTVALQVPLDRGPVGIAHQLGQGRLFIRPGRRVDHGVADLGVRLEQHREHRPGTRLTRPEGDLQAVMQQPAGAPVMMRLGGRQEAPMRCATMIRIAAPTPPGSPATAVCTHSQSRGGPPQPK